MRGYSFPGLSILGMDSQCQRDAFLEVLETHDVNFIVGVDFIVVGGVGKRQGKHSLFFEIGFVDTGE